MQRGGEGSLGELCPKCACCWLIRTQTRSGIGTTSTRAHENWDIGAGEVLTEILLVATYLAELSIRGDLYLQAIASGAVRGSGLSPDSPSSWEPS